MLHFVHGLSANPTSWVAVSIGFSSRSQQNALVAQKNALLNFEKLFSRGMILN